MELSRRQLLVSAAVLPAIGRASVICSLEESRKAFAGISFAGTLVESAVGYASESLGWLRLHGITVHSPREIKGPAWIRYNWPISALVRDFGRVCPVTGGTVIARLGDIPVAVRHGSLIVLGSPIGPHLYAGDREARELFEAIRKHEFIT